MDNQKFGRFIRDLRKKANMTQKELGEKLNVTDKAVSKWERGLGFPDITIINLLAETFGITASEVLNAEIGKKETVDVEKAVQEAVEKVTKEKERKENRKRKLIKFVKIKNNAIYSKYDYSAGGRGGHPQPFNTSDEAFPALGAK